MIVTKIQYAGESILSIRISDEELKELNETLFWAWMTATEPAILTKLLNELENA
ncbi:unnamed protein product [marine sediment metagenome]|uniref:Uncharacterized protein n=1 Tax=marine sediment metagenome TaxID=412755 RepID=X0ZEB3_9ZZZZ